MPRPKRAEQFSHDEICIVHAVQRCVRRAFLAGEDAKTGVDYGFRREWIRRRMEALASVFAVDVLSYAILSNHIHIILRNRPDVVKAWDDKQVALRWLRVFPGQRMEEHLADTTDTEVETLANNRDRITQIRQRMSDISWFMRSLCEPIARLANKQDECTGRFWEGRFKALRITDESALLACAMYVDLNPVRAAMAESPDQSVHTSAYDRIKGTQGKQIDSAAFDLKSVSREERSDELKTTSVKERKQKVKASRARKPHRRVRRDSWLSPLSMNPKVLASDPQVSRSGVRASDKGFLSVAFSEYLALLRWTAKQRSAIGGAAVKVPARLKPVLRKMGIEGSMWRDLVWNFKKYFGRGSCAGSPDSLAEEANRQQRRWYKGQRQAAACFLS